MSQTITNKKLNLASSQLKKALLSCKKQTASRNWILSHPNQRFYKRKLNFLVKMNNNPPFRLRNFNKCSTIVQRTLLIEERSHSMNRCVTVIVQTY